MLTITLGYAAFALTLGLANVSLWHFFNSDQAGAHIRIASMNQLTYRAMQFGVVLLAAGTILGGVWADYSWGRFWGWDPKEVWALIALLCYLRSFTPVSRAGSRSSASPLVDHRVPFGDDGLVRGELRPRRRLRLSTSPTWSSSR